ncbi:MAG: hypothetical protein K5756_04660 [Clostridiales bacterium]|nr:hypothetical protein [Clostridiales bacterium]
MKKAISILFALIFALSVLTLPASAKSADAVQYAKISAVFHSDIAGITDKDYDRLVDLSGGDLKFREAFNEVRVTVHDCVGKTYEGVLKPGRTYEISYEFIAEDGYELPKDVKKNDEGFVCGKGCTVYSCQYISNVAPNTSGPLLYVTTGVLVDCNVFQWIFGKIADLILEIRAWSLY